MEKRSKLEYEATAMLLDMVYDATVHAFVIIPEDPQIPCSYYDADSLREITHEDITLRGNMIFHLGVIS